MTDDRELSDAWNPLGICWQTGCDKPAVVERDLGKWCPEHAPGPLESVEFQPKVQAYPSSPIQPSLDPRGAELAKRKARHPDLVRLMAGLVAGAVSAQVETIDHDKCVADCIKFLDAIDAYERGELNP